MKFKNISTAFLWRDWSTPLPAGQLWKIIDLANTLLIQVQIHHQQHDLQGFIFLKLVKYFN